MQIKLPKSAKNWLSITGVTISIISLLMIVFIWFLIQASRGGGSYLGLISYIILPGILLIGLLFIPIGMIREHKRLKSKKEQWPSIDLNIKTHRNAFFIFIVGTLIFIFMSSIGSYEAFHFTESVQFCGQLCHTVMKPEYTAYQHSAHARVACVECHVGSGANWYVRSKISGLYQVYSVIFHKYPKPIPTPVENLRPARETCERCHWPQKFYTYNQKNEVHFLPDEQNTQWNIDLTLKLGARHSSLGLSEGIHWHINPDVRVEYIAADTARQEIPWVRYVNVKTGKQQTYVDVENPPDSTLLATAEKRVMDCMDCHNRPSHDYQPPSFFINSLMITDSIPKALPEIKSVAIDLCEPEYGTTDSAMQAIAKGIKSFYEENYPEVARQKQELVQRAIRGLQRAYRQNIFPEMKVRWSVHPNNIGHLEFKGCFRCHNGNHKSAQGKVIERKCTLCHLINAQGPPEQMAVAIFGQSLEFKHPVDIDEAWKESLCTDCHTGLNP